MIAATQPPACYATIASYYATNRERGPFHITVVRDGAYAMVGWHGTNTGGQGAFHRVGHRWCKVVSGGGAMDVDGLVSYGVPRPTARRLFAKLQQHAP